METYNSQHELAWMYMHAGDFNNAIPLVCVQDSVVIIKDFTGL